MPFENFDDFWNPFLLGQAPAGAYVKRLTAGRAATLREELRRRAGIPAARSLYPRVCGRARVRS